MALKRIWYVALCTQILPRLFKFWPWVDIDPYYAKVTFGHLGFCMGTRGKNFMFFLETIADWDLKVGWSIQVNDLIKLNEYQGAMLFFVLSQRILRFYNLNLT